MFPSLTLPARVAAIAAAASAAIALTACGGSSSSLDAAALDHLTTTTVDGTWSTTTAPVSADPDDPCTLITTSDAETLLGPVDAVPLPRDVVAGQACSWSAVGSFGASSLELVIAEGEDVFDDALGEEPRNIGPEFGALGFLTEEGSELRLGWILDDDRSVVLTLHSGQGSAAELEDVGVTIAEQVGALLR